MRSAGFPAFQVETPVEYYKYSTHCRDCIGHFRLEQHVVTNAATRPRFHAHGKHRPARSASRLAPLPRDVLVAGAGSSRETDEDLALHSHPPVTKSKEHSPDCPSSHSLPCVRKRNWRSRQGTLGLHLDLVRFCLIAYMNTRIDNR
jgi:hypothetical protein